MVWSFDPALTTEKDWIRVLSGDTDSVTPRVSDETITGVLGLYTGGSLLLRRYTVSAEVARIIAGVVANLVDKQKSDVHKASSQLQKQFQARADQLELSASTMTGGLAPGLTRSDEQATREDTDLRPPHFTDDLHDNPRTPEWRPGFPMLPPYGGYVG